MCCLSLCLQGHPKRIPQPRSEVVDLVVDCSVLPVIAGLHGEGGIVRVQAGDQLADGPISTVAPKKVGETTDVR